ncbi:class I SAM-dependent methyltransferase [Candidatus Micrarchaeota archaeon]|nr:class I SAM-dependent methyltransferase [Candidatus Micrarchaeota archaeon]
MDSRLEHVNCNLCGANDYSVVYPALSGKSTSEADFSASGNDVLTDQVVKCKQCHFVYVNPRLKSQFIVGGYSAAEDKTYVSQSEGRMATFRAGVRLMEKHMPKKGRVLDVGAAAGLFVKAAKENGWDAYGVEPSHWLARYGRETFGLNLKQGTIHTAKYPDAHFDVVTFWDVLEHVPDPAADLKEAMRILKPGGLLVVNYPNFGSRLAKITGRKWWFLLSVHLWYFTPKTMRDMLERNGFEQVYSKRHYQKLSLGYLVYRVQPYNKAIHRVLNALVSALRLQDQQVTYYASQYLVLARKK